MSEPTPISDRRAEPDQSAREDQVTVRLPFVIGVLADLSGDRKTEVLPVRERGFVDVDRESFDEFMSIVAPSAASPADWPYSHENRENSLVFKRLSDFSPLRLIDQVPELRMRHERRSRMLDSAKLLEKDDELFLTVARLAKEKPCISSSDDIAARDTEVLEGIDPETLMALIFVFHNKFEMDQKPNKEGFVDAVSECITQLEAELADGLNKLLHSPEVQAIEAIWRNLHYLVCECETSDLLKVRVFNISGKELLKDVQKATEFDQTNVYKRIWEDGYGLYGGEPVGCLVADFAFDNSPPHTQILQFASDLAVATRMPFLAAAAPTLFQARNWTEAVFPEDLNQLFDSPEYARWRSFRSRPESSHVVLTLPRILLRVPYGPDSDPIDEIGFSESTTTDADFLWGNPAFFVAASIGNAFAGRESNTQEVNWDGLGRIEGYLYHVNEDSDNGLQMSGPLERLFTRHEQQQFADTGFCTLSAEDEGLGPLTADLRTSVSLEALGSASEEPAFAQLELVLAAARLVHALPSVLRESAGSFADKTECEAFLDRNIRQILGRGDDKSARGTLLRALRDVESQVIASSTSAKADSVAWGQSAEVAIRLSIDDENIEGGVRDVRFSVALPPTVTDWRLF